MKIFTLIAILVLCVSISFPSTADAKFSRTAEAKKIALATWGPVCNGEYVPITKTETAWDGYAYFDDDPTFDGIPPYHNCRIGILKNAHWPWEKFCTIIVHEYGHLAGKKHVNNPFKVMNPWYTFPFKPCTKKPTT